MKSSCNQLQHLTNTIPSPFARLNKHPDPLQASNHLKSPGTWHIFAERTFKEQPPGNKRWKKHILYVLIVSSQTNTTSFRIIISKCLDLYKTLQWFPQSKPPKQTSPNPKGRPPQLQQYDIWGLGSFSTTHTSSHHHRHFCVNATKPLLGFELHGDPSAKIAKVRKLLWCFYRAIVTWCYIRARSAVHQVALQTLGGRKGKVYKDLFQIRRWTDTTQKGSWSTYSKLHMILGMSWGDIETKWTNWFLQNSICAKGQAPCYATKPTNYNYSPKIPSKTVGISQSLPKKAKVRTSQDPFITSNVITGHDAPFNP